MLHVISALCVERDLHTITPRPLERAWWRQFAAQWGDCKKSWIESFNLILLLLLLLLTIIIVVVVVVVVVNIINIFTIVVIMNIVSDAWRVNRTICNLKQRSVRVKHTSHLAMADLMYGPCKRHSGPAGCLCYGAAVSGSAAPPQLPLSLQQGTCCPLRQHTPQLAGNIGNSVEITNTAGDWPCFLVQHLAFTESVICGGFVGNENDERKQTDRKNTHNHDKSN